jgi:hypothetical protein
LISVVIGCFDYDTKIKKRFGISKPFCNYFSMLNAGASIQNQKIKQIPKPIKNWLKVVGIPPNTEVNADSITITKTTNRFFFIVLLIID